MFDGKGHARAPQRLVQIIDVNKVTGAKKM